MERPSALDLDGTREHAHHAAPVDHDQPIQGEADVDNPDDHVELILPHIPQLEDLLLDDTISEVMVNRGGREVWGVYEMSEARPALEARLEDGSRVAAMMRPCSPDGPTLTIRKFTVRYNLQQLIGRGYFPAKVAIQLRAGHRPTSEHLDCRRHRRGKTTVLNALVGEIRQTPNGSCSSKTPPQSRSPSRTLSGSNRKRPRGTPPLPGRTIAPMLKDALRHRRDRIIVGEVRSGAEAGNISCRR